MTFADIAISSFSLRALMDDVTFYSVAADGHQRAITLAGSGQLDMAAFLREVRVRLGAGSVELCQVQLDPSPSRIASIGAALAQTGIHLRAMPIDVGDLAHPLAEVRASSLRDTLRWFDVASKLGAATVRVNPISPHGAAAESDARSAGVLDRLADAAAERGMGLLVENKGGVGDYPERMISIVEAVGRDRIGVIVDLGNVDPYASAMIRRLHGDGADEDLGLERLYNAIEFMAPYASVVHAKCHGFDESGETAPLDLRRGLAIVRRAGFNGPVTIEWEGVEGDPWAQTERTMRLVQEVTGPS